MAEIKRTDDDLAYHTPEARDITIRVRDIFDECKDSNPRWLPGLLVEEMYNHGLIDEYQQTLFRRELGAITLVRYVVIKLVVTETHGEVYWLWVNGLWIQCISYSGFKKAVRMFDQWNELYEILDRIEGRKIVGG